MKPEEHNLRREVEKLESFEGQGTELISVYVTPDKNVDSVADRIRNEHAQAENIKSDSTRSNVQKALS